MATDRHLPVREVPPSQRHIAVESIGAPAGRYTPAVADPGSARAVPIVLGTSGPRRKMVIDGLSGNVTFALPGVGGVAALTDTVSIGGTPYTQVFRAIGNGATLANWPAVIGGVTGTPSATSIVQRQCHWSAADRHVMSSGYSNYAFGSVFDPGTADMLLEGVVLVGEGTAEICNKFSTVGFRLFSQSSNIQWRVTATSGTPTALCQINTDLQRQWIYVLATIDQSTGITLYVNGSTLRATAAANYTAGTITSANQLSLGGGANLGTGIAYIGIWQAPGMLASKDQPALADARFAAFLGLEATAGANRLPTAVSRATPAVIPWYPAAGRKSYAFVGPHWIGRARVRDASDVERAGIALVTAQSNSFVNSRDVSASGWQAIRLASRALSASVQGPIDGSRCNALTPDGNNNTHGVSYSVTSSITGQHYLAGIFRQAGKAWVKLQSTGAANAFQYFHLSGAGALGSSGGGITAARIERVYDVDGTAWYVCLMEYPGTNAAHDHDYLICDGDGVDTWLAPGSIAMYMTMPSHQVDQPWYEAPVPTGAAAATRNVDDLRYAATGNVDAAKGTLTVRATDNPIGVQNIARRVVEMATDASNGTRLTRSATSAPAAQWETGAVLQADLAAADGSVADRVSREAVMTWAANRFTATFGGTPAPGSPDTSGTPPALTTIFIGATLAGASGMGGIVEAIEIKDR